MLNLKWMDANLRWRYGMLKFIILNFLKSSQKSWNIILYRSTTVLCSWSYSIILLEFADDSMALMMAFETPNLEIVGLTTTFGNVSTKDATRNALILVFYFFWVTPLFCYYLFFCSIVFGSCTWSITGFSYAKG